MSPTLSMSFILRLTISAECWKPQLLAITRCINTIVSVFVLATKKIKQFFCGRLVIWTRIWAAVKCHMYFCNQSSYSVLTAQNNQKKSWLTATSKSHQQWNDSGYWHSLKNGNKYCIQTSNNQVIHISYIKCCRLLEHNKPTCTILKK